MGLPSNAHGRPRSHTSCVEYLLCTRGGINALNAKTRKHRSLHSSRGVRAVRSNYRRPLNSVWVRGTDPCTVVNPHITFDSAVEDVWVGAMEGPGCWCQRPKESRRRGDMWVTLGISHVLSELHFLVHAVSLLSNIVSFSYICRYFKTQLKDSFNCEKCPLPLGVFSGSFFSVWWSWNTAVGPEGRTTS